MHSLIHYEDLHSTNSRVYLFRVPRPQHDWKGQFWGEPNRVRVDTILEDMHSANRTIAFCCAIFIVCHFSRGSSDALYSFISIRVSVCLLDCFLVLLLPTWPSVSVSLSTRCLFVCLTMCLEWLWIYSYRLTLYIAFCSIRFWMRKHFRLSLFGSIDMLKYVHKT